MTVLDVLVESARLGVRLEARKDRLLVEAPKGAVTPAFRAVLLDHKPMLLEVLWRIAEMQRLAVVAPRAVVYARESAKGGPGFCFSCSDPLEHRAAYGRCTPCDLAADAFYALRLDSMPGEEVS